MASVHETVIVHEDKIGKVFLKDEDIDEETKKQIEIMMKEECVENPRIMPDCHKGNGCCIGFTFPLNGKIVPNYIGGDIGCGIVTINLGSFKHQKKLEKIDKIIREQVPMGNGYKCVHTVCVASNEDREDLFTHTKQIAENFVKSYEAKFGDRLVVPNYGLEWFNKLCKKVQADSNYVWKELGTLGGGNHYIEVNIDETTNEKYLTVHCGSRNLGSKICAYHQAKIGSRKLSLEEYNEEYLKHNPTREKLSKKAHKTLSEKVKEIIKQRSHKPFLENEEAYEYFFDMIFAQSFAQFNRYMIIRRIMTALPYNINNFDISQVIESVHNTIDFTDLMIRKGAIAARHDELCIVSLNMRDGILLCRGMGNADWNCSGPHGLGRIMDRGQAKRYIKLGDFQKSMTEVFSTSVNMETIDESPMAYKDPNLILASIGESISIIKQLKPIINVKA